MRFLAPTARHTPKRIDQALMGQTPTLGAGEVVPPLSNILHVGDILDGKYEIRQLLGSGGMGQVYEAKDRGLNRLVAIKTAWPHVGTEPLRREAQVLAAFRHSGLVTAHALAQHEGRDFLVMERLTGAPLADTMQRRLQDGRQFTIPEAIELMLAISGTLGLIHGSGLAHCDLKPANIILTVGRVVLLDFGIVRIEQLRGNDRLVSGSPHYMAPESVRANVLPGKAFLVDIYALGVIGYMLVTGRPPFDAVDPVDLMMQHVEQEPPPPTKFRPDCPPLLERTLLAMLAKDAEDRPHSIEEVEVELRSVTAGRVRSLTSA
jgi:serine/threonine-protein kinase